MVEIRLITAAELEPYQYAVDAAFGGDPDPEELASWRPLVEVERSHAAFDGPDMVGTAAVLTVDMTVPGGPAPCAAVTAVTVAATHRRRGVLTAMMRTQLDAVRDRGTEAYAALWASEPVIYHRFGYGVASRRWQLTVHAHDPELVGGPPTGRVRLLPPDEAPAVAAPIHDAVRHQRPGMISRTPTRWTARFTDLPAQRSGATALKYAVYETADGPRGYAVFRTKGEWADARPQGQVKVVELLALDADAHGGLWRFLLGIDLMRSVHCDNIPSDDAILWRLRDQRVNKAHVSDGLHVRVLDVPTALTTRAYAGAGSVTVEVVDPWGYAGGRWTLDASPAGATCTPATASADLTLSAEELGAVYLGETTLRALHGAGRVDEHTPGAVARASALLAWPVAAWCPEIF